MEVAVQREPEYGEAFDDVQSRLQPGWYSRIGRFHVGYFCLRSADQAPLSVPSMADHFPVSLPPVRVASTR